MLRNKLYIYGDDTGEVPLHMNLGKEMFDRMLSYKDVTALINSDTCEKVTYTELVQQITNIALSLTRIGIRKGDVISICSEKRFEVMATLLGIVCAGATYSPFQYLFGEAQLLRQANIAKPKIVFFSPDAYDVHKRALDSAETTSTYIVYGKEAKAGAILFSDFVTESSGVEDFLPTPVNGWEDRIFILFSSGTTGLPKGVPLTHLNLLSDCKLFKDGPSRHIGKRILSTREWYVTYGMLSTIRSLRCGATIIFSQRNEISDWFSAIQNFKIQILELTPSSIMGMIKSQDLGKYDLSSVKFIMSASTALMAEQVKLIMEKIPSVIQVISNYGMTEAGCVSSNSGTTDKLRPGSSGVVSPGFICKVVDIETREPLGPNQRGEICFKSPSLIKGYVGCDLTDVFDEEGFFKSGDLGYYDEDRHIYIVDRIKELIKFKDSNVAPEEFEAILLQHEAVREVGVVGVPHEEYGQAPLAFVVLQPNLTTTAEELTTFLHDRVTYRMRLAGGVRFVDKLPRGAGDKLDRKTLKQMAENLHTYNYNSKVKTAIL